VGTADCVRRARKAGIPVREVGDAEALMEHGYSQKEMAELRERPR
jgi:GT2 family glycosyltransferase